MEHCTLQKFAAPAELQASFVQDCTAGPWCARSAQKTKRRRQNDTTPILQTCADAEAWHGRSTCIVSGFLFMCNGARNLASLVALHATSKAKVYRRDPVRTQHYSFTCLHLHGCACARTTPHPLTSAPINDNSIIPVLLPNGQHYSMQTSKKTCKHYYSIQTLLMLASSIVATSTLIYDTLISIVHSSMTISRRHQQLRASRQAAS